MPPRCQKSSIFSDSRNFLKKILVLITHKHSADFDLPSTCAKKSQNSKYLKISLDRYEFLCYTLQVHRVKIVLRMLRTWSSLALNCNHRTQIWLRQRFLTSLDKVGLSGKGIDRMSSLNSFSLFLLLTWIKAIGAINLRQGKMPHLALRLRIVLDCPLAIHTQLTDQKDKI